MAKIINGSNKCQFRKRQFIMVILIILITICKSTAMSVTTARTQTTSTTTTTIKTTTPTTKTPATLSITTRPITTTTINTTGTTIIKSETSPLTTTTLPALAPELAVISNIFVPFGVLNGDIQIQADDDSYSWISFQHRFYQSTYAGVYVSSNGIICSNAGYSNLEALYEPKRFPINDYGCFAPFWADINVLKGGSIYYRIVTDWIALRSINNDIANAYPQYGNLHIKSALVVTYDRVSSFWGPSSLTNTFQAVLISNNDFSFVIFNYGKLMWSDDKNAEAGINAGNGVDYYLLPGSFSNDIVNLSNTSNVGVKGKWIYRVDTFTNSNQTNGSDIPRGFIGYGSSYGDTQLPPADDGNSGSIYLNFSYYNNYYNYYSYGFKFFNSYYSFIYISYNGFIGFNWGNDNYKPVKFPTYNPMIALFWADIDILKGGTIYYRTVSNNDELVTINNDIAKAYPNYNLRSKWAFVVTYDKVKSYWDSESLTNTFQAILVSDGTLSFVILNYGNLSWSDSKNAEAGINYGNGISYTILPGSFTNDILNLFRTSNVGVNGKWIYRVDTDDSSTGQTEVDPRSSRPYISSNTDFDYTSAYTTNASPITTGTTTSTAFTTTTASTGSTGTTARTQFG